VHFSTLKTQRGTIIDGMPVGVPTGVVPIPGTAIPGIPTIPVRSINIALDMVRPPVSIVSTRPRRAAQGKLPFPEARPSGLPRLRADYRQTGVRIATNLTVELGAAWGGRAISVMAGPVPGR
jgi:hypothetical protein